MEKSAFIVSVISGIGLVPIGYYFAKFVFYKRLGEHIEAEICLRNVILLIVVITVISLAVPLFF